MHWSAKKLATKAGAARLTGWSGHSTTWSGSDVAATLQEFMGGQAGQLGPDNFGSPIDEIISENDFVPPGRTVQGSIEMRYAYVRLGTKLTVLTMLTEPGKLRLKAVSITLLILTEAG